jgi:hypothetical protein
MNAFRVAPNFWALTLLACAGGRQAAPPAWRPADAACSKAQPVRVDVAAQEVESTPPAPVAAQVQPAEAPTWSAIYARHFGPGTEGACGRSRVCHAAVMTDAPSAYEWLAQRGYIGKAQSALVSKSNSCLRWFGGNMPPRGKTNEDAVRDLEAWAAAGAVNN